MFPLPFTHLSSPLDLTPYLPKDKIRKERSLLSSAEEEAEGEQTDDVSFLVFLVAQNGRTALTSTRYRTLSYPTGTL